MLCLRLFRLKGDIMRKICIINQKGGVGKTTTITNLAFGLESAGKRVLVIDLDPQGNVSTCVNARSDKDIYDVLVNNANASLCVKNVITNLDLISSKETLTKAELMLAGESSRETVLKRKLATISGYDFVLLDCAPSLGLLNQNAMLYADEIFIPTSTDALGVVGLTTMIKAIDKLNEVFNHNAKITCVIPTMYDSRSKICKTTLVDLKNSFNSLLADPIRVSSKLKEAPKFGKSIFEYDKKGHAAKDYALLIDKVLGVNNSMSSQVTAAPVQQTV